MINQDEWEWPGDRHRSTFQMVFHGCLVKYSPFFFFRIIQMKQPNLVMDGGFQRFLVSGIFNPKLVCLRSLFFYKLGGKGISAPTSHNRFKKTTQLGGGFHRFL